MMRKTRTTLVIVMGLLAVFMLAASCAALPMKPPPTINPETPAAVQTQPGSLALTKPMPPIEVDLTMRGRPTLGATVQVDLTVKPLVAAPNTTITLTLPAVSVEFVGGEPAGAIVQRAESPATGSVQHAAWQVALQKEETKSLTTAIRITQNGYHRIHAYVFIDLGTTRWGNFADLYLVVDGAEAWVGKQPPQNNWEGSGLSPAGTLIPPENSPVQGRLYLVEPLSLDRETELIYEITASTDLDNLTLGIILPRKGLVIVQSRVPGETNLTPFSPEQRPTAWRGRMAKGERVMVQVRLRPVLTGEGVIGAYVSQETTTSLVLLHNAELRDLKVYVPRLAE